MASTASSSRGLLASYFHNGARSLASATTTAAAKPSSLSAQAFSTTALQQRPPRLPKFQALCFSSSTQLRSRSATVSQFVPNLKGTDKPYHPGPISPAPKPDVKPKVRAVNPFPTHVESFVRSFPSFLPEGFHQIPRSVVAANPIRKDLINLAVVWKRDDMRQGTHKEKDRAEVSGSRRKLRPQKGLGRARVGDSRPPHFRGGGVAHARRPRDYSTELPAKVQRAALRAALTTKFVQNQFTVVSSFREPAAPKVISDQGGEEDVDDEDSDDEIDKEAEEELKYKEAKEKLQERLKRFLAKNTHKDYTKRKVLICISRSPEDDKTLLQLEQREHPVELLSERLDNYWALYEAVHHLEGVEVVHANELDVYRIIKYQDLIIEKEALDSIVQRLEL